MRTLQWYGTKDVRVVDHPKPAVTDAGDAVIKISSACICGRPASFFGCDAWYEEGRHHGARKYGHRGELGAGSAEDQARGQVSASVLSCMPPLPPPLTSSQGYPSPLTVTLLIITLSQGGGGF